MTAIQSKAIDNSKHNQGVKPSAAGKLAGSEKLQGQELFDEFSRILDKIAVTLAEGSETGVMAASAVHAAATAPKVEKSNTVKKPEQSVKNSEDSKEPKAEECKAVQPAATEAQSQTQEGSAENKSEQVKTDAAGQAAASVKEKAPAAEQQTESTAQEADTEAVTEDLELSADDQSAEDEQNSNEETTLSAEDQVVIVDPSITKTLEQKCTAQDEEVEGLPEGTENSELEQVAVPAQEVQVAGQADAQVSEQAQADIQKQFVDSGAAEELASAEQLQLNYEIATALSEKLAKAESSSNAAAEVSEDQKWAADLLPEAGKDSQKTTTEATQLMQALLLNTTADKTIVVKEVGNVGTNNQSNSPIALSGQSAVRREVSEGQAEKAERMPKAFSTRTLTRVEEALKEVAKSKDGKTISVRLDPPSLGSVKIDVTFKDGSINARLLADNAQVTNLLREHGSDLQAAIRKLGLTVDNVVVQIVSQEAADSGEFNAFMHGQKDSGARNESQAPAFVGENEENFEEVSSSVNVDHWVA